ncbi:MAG: hypothetical protein ABJV04_02395 [Aliiglaciecola sp.]|uniref:hypothetical protein n=1 Tax=Aliiglaciecola sp. TaxID=1872441 RepID=UPI003299BFCB
MGELQSFLINAGYAALVFGFIKMSFGIFGWLSQEASDNQIRKGIDLSWDYINRKSIVQKSNSLILLTLVVINSNFKKIKRTQIGMYFLLIFAINAIILFNFLISASVVVDSKNIFAFGFHAFFLSFLNILCLFIVYFHTLMLPKTLNLFVINLKVILSLFSVFCIWYFAGTFFYDSLYYDFYHTQVIDNTVNEQGNNNFILALNKLGLALIAAISSILLCLIQAIPLIIFMFIMLLGFLLNVFPRLLTHSLFLVSTDKTPVFNQLGTFFGFLIGGLALIIKLLAKYA